jgi:hypothetical protein
MYGKTALQRRLFSGPAILYDEVALCRMDAMFEHHTKPVIPFPTFIARMSANFIIAMCFTGLSLCAGMAGYRFFEGLPWIDAYLNAAMILGGMGAIDPIKTEGGKIFAGLYALYSGLWVVASIGLLLAPVFHRILHRFHSQQQAGKQ